MTRADSIIDLVQQTRQQAGEVVARHKRHSSFRLYDVLAPCLAICERCERDPDERAEIDRLFAEQPKVGQNRRYVEKGSDIYQLVCRYVFAGTYLTNATRYAQALREAAKMQIRSADLATWLRHNGGVNALYFRRPLAALAVEMKTLRLTEPVRVQRHKAFSLTLRWQPDNTFKVLAGVQDD
jgi:hypothetical protein